MSHHKQQQPPVGVPAPQGYPQENPKDANPPPGHQPQGYPSQEYPPAYANGYTPPPPPKQGSTASGCFACLKGCLAALCCRCVCDACI